MEKTLHSRPLYILSLSSAAERFSYYGMRAVLCLYMASSLFSQTTTMEFYACFIGLAYLSPLMGGYLAGRYWGRQSVIIGGTIMAIGHLLLFASAATVQQSIFIENGEIAESVDNFVSKLFLFCGLGALVLGTGLFKPIMSSYVGDLYAPSDTRKEKAYTLYYMAINIGALLAPLLCGLFEGSWSDPRRFAWAFLIAACVMVASVIQFLWMQRGLIGPNGEIIGQVPSKHAQGSQDVDKNKQSDLTFISKALCFTLGIVLIWLFGIGASSASDWISAVIYSCSIVVPLSILLDRNLTKVERSRIVVIYVIVAFGLIFWSLTELCGAALTIFAKKNVDCTISGWEMPSVWLQSVNPTVIVTCAPLIVWIWRKLSTYGMDPSPVIKQAIGILFVSIGFAVMVYATSDMTFTSKIAIFWIILLYFLHSVGELCLSPIGMSLVNSLSPSRLASLMMGVWFLNSAAAGVITGKLSTLMPLPGQPASQLLGFSIETFSDYFFVLAVLGGLPAIILALLNPVLKRMSKGIL